MFYFEIYFYELLLLIEIGVERGVQPGEKCFEVPLRGTVEALPRKRLIFRAITEETLLYGAETSSEMDLW